MFSAEYSLSAWILEWLFEWKEGAKIQIFIESDTNFERKSQSAFLLTSGEVTENRHLLEMEKVNGVFCEVLHVLTPKKNSIYIRKNNMADRVDESDQQQIKFYQIQNG